jgi:hypothetical protein
MHTALYCKELSRVLQIIIPIHGSHKVLTWISHLKMTKSICVRIIIMRGASQTATRTCCRNPVRSTPNGALNIHVLTHLRPVENGAHMAPMRNQRDNLQKL